MTPQRLKSLSPRRETGRKDAARKTEMARAFTQLAEAIRGNSNHPRSSKSAKHGGARRAA